MNDPHAPPFTRDFLTDGYISHTLGTPNTDSYLVRLFQIAATTLVQAIRHQSGAFYALNRPSYHIPPAISILGREAWLVDYAVRPGGSVVPQQLWSPQGQGDQSRYVDRPQYRMHVFFVNMDGSLGVPVVNAAAGHMQLRGADLPPQLVDRTTIKIRIGVCVRSLPACSRHSSYVSQWPGYPPSEYQVQLRPAGNPITFERFVQLVGTRVRRFLEVSVSRKWRGNERLSGSNLGLRARFCPTL
jgi:hypothetical protein